MSASPAPAPRMAGRRVLLTGATSGVGLAAVSAFAREGCVLALIARNEVALAEAAAQARALGAVAHPLVADLTVRDEVATAVAEAVARMGGLDVVVSNAAGTVFGHFLEVEPEDFDRSVEVTFTGAVNVVRATLGELRASRGTIVATGSVMATVPLPTFSSYAAAKHALRGFLNSVSIEEREQGTGVRVAMVHPGPLDTPLFSRTVSATGRKPRIAPDAYRPEVVAQALVETAVDPRPERILGGEYRVLVAAYHVVRPVTERVLVLVDRWYRSGQEPAASPGALRQPTGHATLSGGQPGRDSLLAAASFGRRLVPDARTPLHLARNLTTTARGAFATRRQLMHPVAEPPESALPRHARRAARDRPSARGPRTQAAGPLDPHGR